MSEPVMPMGAFALPWPFTSTTSPIVAVMASFTRLLSMSFGVLASRPNSADLPT
ncbi:hypothetical protein D3C85_1933650 [compost metagenome]